jgi:hypothetical protein
VPNLVNMADGVTAPILNPESVSWYDGLYEVGCHHAAVTPEDNKLRQPIQIPGSS